MLLVIESVLWLVLLYSASYMLSDAHLVSFLGLLNGFAFSMIVLVLADNMVLLFLGWESVGLCSYGLIAHYSARSSASRAAMKAVMLNKLGDYGLFLALIVMLCMLHCSS